MTSRTTPPEPAGPVAYGEDVVVSAHGCYELVDHDGAPEILPDAATGNGVVALGSTGALISTGTFHGPLRVRLEIHRRSPRVRADGWHRIVEVSQHTVSGMVSVDSHFADPPPQLPTFVGAPDSWYRIRIHVAGGHAVGHLPFGPGHPVERHLIQIWPTEKAAMPTEE
ncbi:hypothetical protein [Micromonospora rifamycinica]|uniref:Uncharacterized protein n=1 Tax=Micromonospora rifamycinica TaxID=291594 RepID=A0A1C5JXR7_9ACTN|nr:hypothetical protein [Micromonospora rifamycinica]SCG74806.1 hypothetical protein GA0070623_3927 [Micromonospora rifamycinica]